MSVTEIIVCRWLVRSTDDATLLCSASIGRLCSAVCRPLICHLAAHLSVPAILATEPTICLVLPLPYLTCSSNNLTLSPANTTNCIIILPLPPVVASSTEIKWCLIVACRFVRTLTILLKNNEKKLWNTFLLTFIHLWYVQDGKKLQKHGFLNCMEGKYSDRVKLSVDYVGIPH